MIGVEVKGVMTTMMVEKAEELHRYTGNVL